MGPKTVTEFRRDHPTFFERGKKRFHGLTPGSYLIQIWTREREFENVVLAKAAKEAAKDELSGS